MFYLHAMLIWQMHCKENVTSPYLENATDEYWLILLEQQIADATADGEYSRVDGGKLKAVECCVNFIPGFGDDLLDAASNGGFLLVD